MLFIEVSELKAKLDLSVIDLIRSPKSGKLFGAGITNSGIPVNLKVEQAIDTKLPTKYMYESVDSIMEGCIVNVTPTTPPLHSW